MTLFILGVICGLFIGAIIWNKNFRDKLLQGLKKKPIKKDDNTTLKPDK